MYEGKLTVVTRYGVRSSANVGSAVGKIVVFRCHTVVDTENVGGYHADE